MTRDNGNPTETHDMTRGNGNPTETHDMTRDNGNPTETHDMTRNNDNAAKPYDESETKRRRDFIEIGVLSFIAKYLRRLGNEIDPETFNEIRQLVLRTRGIVLDRKTLIQHHPDLDNLLFIIGFGFDKKHPIVSIDELMKATEELSKSSHAYNRGHEAYVIHEIKDDLFNKEVKPEDMEDIKTKVFGFLGFHADAFDLNELGKPITLNTNRDEVVKRRAKFMAEFMKGLEEGQGKTVQEIVEIAIGKTREAIVAGTINDYSCNMPDGDLSPCWKDNEPSKLLGSFVTKFKARLDGSVLVIRNTFVDFSNPKPENIRRTQSDSALDIIISSKEYYLSPLELPKDNTSSQEPQPQQPGSAPQPQQGASSSGLYQGASGSGSQR